MRQPIDFRGGPREKHRVNLYPSLCNRINHEVLTLVISFKKIPLLIQPSEYVLETAVAGGPPLFRTAPRHGQNSCLHNAAKVLDQLA
jgi:hypothetical protein